MSLYKQKPKRKKKLAIILVVALALLAGGYYWYTTQESLQKQEASGSIDYGSPSAEVIEAGNEAKARTVQEDEKTRSDNASNEAPDEKDKAFSLDISTVVSSHNLRVSSIISGIHSGGSCKLTLTKGSQVVTKTSGVQPLAQYSSCEGFDVPLASGEWRVVLDVTISGETVTKSTSIEVS